MTISKAISLTNQKIKKFEMRLTNRKGVVGYATSCTGSLMRPFRYTAIVAGSKLPMMLTNKKAFCPKQGGVG